MNARGGAGQREEFEPERIASAEGDTEITLTFGDNRHASTVFGQYDQKKDPVWLRAHTTWSAAAGAKEFITESTLASTIAPTVAPATASTEPSIAREAAGVAADAGVDAAAARIPGGSYIPSVGGLFNRNSTPQPRKTVLLFVVTTSPVAQPAGVRTPR